jgi:hypothetical protein
VNLAAQGLENCIGFVGPLPESNRLNPFLYGMITAHHVEVSAAKYKDVENSRLIKL